jgi:hypothetical protein
MKINRLVKLWGSQKFLSYRAKAIHWLLLFLAIGCLMLIPLTGTTAQTSPRVVNRLPAPPPIPTGKPSNPKIPKAPVQPTTAAPAMPTAIREYTFQVPQAEPIAIPSQTTSNTPLSSSPVSTDKLYRVEVVVVGDTEEVLAQVRQVEPLAFVRVGEGLIQAGLFPDAGEAQQRLLALQQQGLAAKVVDVGQEDEVASGASRKW